jgi:hypothetical protein
MREKRALFGRVVNMLPFSINPVVEIRTKHEAALPFGKSTVCVNDIVDLVEYAVSNLFVDEDTFGAVGISCQNDRQGAIAELYAPSLYWIGYLSDQEAAASYCELFLNPKSPQIHALVRMSILLGEEFCGWLLGKWKRKWAKHPQPPSFYFTFQQMCDEASGADFRSVAARLSPAKVIQCHGEQQITVAEALKTLVPHYIAPITPYVIKGASASAVCGSFPDDARTSGLLSRACMLVFEGHREERSIARDLDYIVYGRLVRGRSTGLSNAIVSTVGHRVPGDFADAATA